MGTKYYVRKEALKARGREYFKSLDLYKIKMNSDKFVDGIYYEQDDMYDYWLYLDPESGEEEAFELFAEDED